MYRFVKASAATRNPSQLTKYLFRFHSIDHNQNFFTSTFLFLVSRSFLGAMCRERLRCLCLGPVCSRLCGRGLLRNHELWRPEASPPHPYIALNLTKQLQLLVVLVDRKRNRLHFSRRSPRLLWIVTMRATASMPPTFLSVEMPATTKFYGKET